MSYSEANDFAEKERVLKDMAPWCTYLNEVGRGSCSLEIGGAGGLLAGMFAQKYGQVTCTDIVDWEAQYNGQFVALLREKFERNGRVYDPRKVDLKVADAQALNFADDAFDFVFSLNAFEHIPDPAAALREAIRVVRPGGRVYIQFDPVWTADSGSHFLHRIGQPWAHLVMTDDEVSALMMANGADVSEIESYRSDMNRRPASYYRQILPRVASEAGASLIERQSWSGVCENSFLRSPNLARAATILEVPQEDLLIRGFRYVFEKG